ncbi:hypothetical protein pipiens_007926 [Culex pipiens pipiens]|uniref:C2H2-type domain-containing protein n=1 Tax=Culex pipiens pipiens TaxID=38569 RepID=A0ABD1DJJ1_CULPP
MSTPAADGYSLAQLVALIGDIEVRPEDTELSAWCCVQCQMDVGAAYRVRVLCQESDRKLREMVEEAVVETSSAFQMEEESSTSKHADAFEEIPNTKQRCCGCHRLFDTVEELVAHSLEQYAVGETQAATRTESLRRLLQVGGQAVHGAATAVTRALLFRSELVVSCFSPSGTSPGMQCRKTFPNQKSQRAHGTFITTRFPKVYALWRVFTDFNEYRTLFNHKSSMARHVKKYHLKNAASAENNPSRIEDTEEAVQSAGRSFSLPATLRLHEETHADPTVNVCPYCAKEFDDRIKCERHVRDVHEQSRHQCEPCGKAYKCRKTLIRHNIVEHGIPGPYACDRCPVSFALAGEVKDHRRKFHPDGVSSEDQVMEMEEEGEASWECKLEVEEPKLVGLDESEREEEEDDGAKA